MFKHLFFSCLLLAVVLPSAVWAAPKGEKVGTIREAHAAFKNNGSGNCAENSEWKDEAKSNTKFRQLDCFKTDNGGAVRLELNDNSSFSIAENSLVVISNLVEKDESGAFRIKLDIQKGYMGFKAEKKKGHEVDFTTGTAAASIRGTEGIIGTNNVTFFAGLKTGELSVKLSNGDTLTIAEGQTVIADTTFKNRFLVLPLESSGDMEFAKILNEILADTTLSIDSLASEIQQADKVYQKKVKSSKEAAIAQDSVASVQDTALPVIESAVAVNDSIKQNKVNVPEVKYSFYDSLRCVANVTVSGIDKGSEASLKTKMDGSQIAESPIKRNMLAMVSLRSGIHDYEFVAENAAGSNAVKKTLGCFPNKPFSVKVFGKQHVSLQIPPPPPGVADIITQTMQFQIRVPENDPIVLNKVVVKQNSKVILQERLSQIQNLDYQIPVELKRGHTTRFDIEVVHKSGYTVKTFKEYEVGK